GPRAPACRRPELPASAAGGADRPCGEPRGSFAELLDDAAHAAHGFLEHGTDLVERHRAPAVAAAGRIVRHHGDCRVFEADLARERRLRHAGHADEIGAVALQAIDLGRALEARTLSRGIDPALADRFVAGLRRRG